MICRYCQRDTHKNSGTHSCDGCGAPLPKMNSETLSFLVKVLSQSNALLDSVNWEHMAIEGVRVNAGAVREVQEGETTVHEGRVFRPGELFHVAPPLGYGCKPLKTLV